MRNLLRIVATAGYVAGMTWELSMFLIYGRLEQGVMAGLFFLAATAPWSVFYWRTEARYWERVAKE